MPEVDGLSLEHRRASLFRNGRNQALRIPKAFELPGTEVLIHREGDRLIIEPVEEKKGLLAVLAGFDPLDEDFPDIDGDTLPLDDIRCFLEAAGDPIGPNDLLIAAHARTLDLTLVTANFTEFSRVPGLRVENWLG